MEIQPNSMIQSINITTLTPIVRRALGSEHAQIIDWQGGPISGGVGNPVSVGLFRFRGTAQIQGAAHHWSVILKAIQSPANIGRSNMGEGDDMTHWNYWKRELLVYQSGLLGALPDGMVAPQYLGITELSGDYCWLWLEDIVDCYEEGWPLASYELTARYLGRLNGRYLSENRKPQFPWLSVNRFRQWLEIVPWKTISWDHPLVRARYPNKKNSFRSMVYDHERFISRLDQLPGCICHGDSYPTNFKARRLPNGQEQTVALDWALTGFEALGDDLGQLVFGALSNLKDASPKEVDKILFESYLDGLRDSGCRVDARLVRFGYVASAALRIGLFQLFLLEEQISQSTADAMSAAGMMETAVFEQVMTEEAYQLIATV